ncbi:Zinc-binding dehydrogenase [Fragilaria crotonensis]|nr:Zinc-binding dehydrogenase [Fragilaria crotonensis]
MSTEIEILSKTRVGGPNGGYYHKIKHASTSTGTDMEFGLYLPLNHDKNNTKITTPVLYWLSGLTCTEANFSTKAGSRAFNVAEREGIAMVLPDTSPRGDNVPNVDSYDLGQGAGFYINATQSPYDANYQMYTYVTQELPALLEKEFQLSSSLKSISGHSMGGHGALTIALKDPKSWVSVSAFSPICNPTNCPWGQKAFTAYLGSVEAGELHDATVLLSKRTTPVLEFDDILIDQGDADEFLVAGQLLPEAFQAAASNCGQKVTVHMREGFDHSYHFIAAFIEDHVVFHSKRLHNKI